MKNTILAGLFLLTLNATAGTSFTSPQPFRSDSILKYARLTDDYIRFIKHPDYWNNTVVGGKSRPSNIWTRGVFYEGHMALYHIAPDTALFNYAYNWGKNFNWQVAYGKATTTSGDDQCCGQTYLELYKLKPSADMVTGIKTCLDNSKTAKNYTYWNWVDALQMAMPVWALLGSVTKDTSYYNYLYTAYAWTRNTCDATGLFNQTDGLWWRDKNFNPPVVNTNGKQIYWSRGNGWAFAALVRTLEFLPTTETHYQEYLADFLRMAPAVKASQRNDGFWNASLADSVLYAGKETTGTGLFVYGLAWGINKGYLDRATYAGCVRKGWLALQTEAIHPNGFLGWVQGSADDPSDNYPFGYDVVPNFEDFGAGCVLLAAAESYKFSRTLEKEDSLANQLGKSTTTPLPYSIEGTRFRITPPSRAAVSVYAANGIRLEEFAIEPNVECSLDLASKPRGLYLIRISTRQGMQTVRMMR